MSTRVITVKGSASLRVKPDQLLISMRLEDQAAGYQETMDAATHSLERMREAVISAGFTATDLKTSDFNVRANYESYRDENQNYKNRFIGYLCEQQLNLRFDLDQARLATVLAALAGSNSNPNLNIQFTVKDQAAVSEALLLSATEQARTKAEILAKASSVKLGDLLSIDYSWVDLNLYSPTRVSMDDRAMLMRASATPEILPEDIEVNDHVTFVWSIV